MINETKFGRISFGDNAERGCTKLGKGGVVKGPTILPAENSFLNLALTKSGRSMTLLRFVSQPFTNKINSKTKTKTVYKIMS